MKPGDSSKTRTPRPAVDEWGIYDPSQAGLAALFDRLEAARVALVDHDAPQVAKSMSDATRLAERFPAKTSK